MIYTWFSKGYSCSLRSRGQGQGQDGEMAANEMYSKYWRRFATGEELGVRSGIVCDYPTGLQPQDKRSETTGNYGQQEESMGAVPQTKPGHWCVEDVLWILRTNTHSYCIANRIPTAKLLSQCHQAPTAVPCSSIPRTNPPPSSQPQPGTQAHYMLRLHTKAQGISRRRSGWRRKQE